MQVQELHLHIQKYSVYGISYLFISKTHCPYLSAKLKLSVIIKEKGIKFFEKIISYYIIFSYYIFYLYILYLISLYIISYKCENLSQSLDTTKLDTAVRYAFRDGLKESAIDGGFGYITSERRKSYFRVG